jgi:hypothetical protein
VILVPCSAHIAFENRAAARGCRRRSCLSQLYRIGSGGDLRSAHPPAWFARCYDGTLISFQPQHPTETHPGDYPRSERLPASGLYGRVWPTPTKLLKYRSREGGGCVFSDPGSSGSSTLQHGRRMVRLRRIARRYQVGTSCGIPSGATDAGLLARLISFLTEPHKDN